MEKYRKVLHELIEKIDSEEGLKRLYRLAQHFYIHMKRGAENIVPLFDEAVNRYNAKQTRKDRMIDKLLR